MALIVRLFNGKLNMDASPYQLPKSDYSDALNITRDAQGTGQDLVVSNIVGNQLVSYDLPSGTKKRIGSHEDKLRNRVYYFVWNNYDYDLILYYDKSTGSIVKVFANLTDTGGVDVSNFDPSFRINHVNIIYDNENGDLLYWVDGLNNPPSYINVERAVNNGYGTIKRSYINVIKEPPDFPIYGVYENDNTITVNNLTKQLFKFKARYWFLDNDKSVTSSQSEVPLPIDSIDTNITSDATKNAKIGLVIRTGQPNVKKIELFVSFNLGAAWSIFYRIDVLNKDEQNIPDNDIYLYYFYNNKSFTALDEIESVQGFDFVPLQAVTQALPNGNVPTYVGIKEGYNLPTSIDTSSSSSSSETYRRTQAKALFVVAQSGEGIGLPGNNIHIIVAGLPQTGDTFLLTTTNDTFTATGFSSITNVLNSLASQATIAGYTIVSQDANNLIIQKNGEQLLKYSLTPSSVALGISDTTSAYDWWDLNNFGKVYFDAEGRTNGVITTMGLEAQVSGYSETAGTPNIPTVTISIYNQPPDWAYSYHIVRTNNLKKSRFLQWISDRTFKDNVASIDGKKYAYISIENLNQFIKENPSSGFLAYTFITGDRIRFIKLYPTGGLTTPQLYSSKDYEILGSLVDPSINGKQYEGQFIKILLPDTGADFDFGIQFHLLFPDGIDYSNYFIELYTPSKPAGTNLNTSYEFGERYQIGNPTLSTRFHQGKSQNQSTNYVTPAVIFLDKGDYYLRNRVINASPEYEFTILEGDVVGDYFIPMNLDKNFDAIGYTAQSVVLSRLSGNLQDSDNWLINVTDGNAYTFNIRGNISLKAAVSDALGFTLRFYSVAPDGSGSNVIVATETNVVEDKQYDYVINTSLTVAAGETKIFFMFIAPVFSSPLVMHVVSGDLIIGNYDRVFNQIVIDPNFSDTFQSAVNSNARPWVAEPNAAQIYNPVLMRFGGAYQNGTTINQTNRFYEENLDEYDRTWGNVVKLFVDRRYLYVFHEFNIGTVPILTQIVKDVEGNPLEANSDQLLNKITYPYGKQFGLGNVPESFAYGKNGIYGIDNNKGIVWRIGKNGMEALSVVYECNAFFVPKLVYYKNTLNNGNPPAGGVYTGNPTCYGIFDSYTNKYIISLEEINRYDSQGDLIFHQDAHTISFLETRDESEGFESMYSYASEGMDSLNNLLVSFKNGTIWTHDSNIFCNFFGVQYSAYIDGVFNDSVLEKKTWQALTQISDTIWNCPLIYTNVMSYRNQRQETVLIERNFKLLEQYPSASILRDRNSKKGIYNGDFMKGSYIVIRFQKTNPNELVTLSGVSVLYKDSALTAH